MSKPARGAASRRLSVGRKMAQVSAALEENDDEQEKRDFRQAVSRESTPKRQIVRKSLPRNGAPGLPPKGASPQIKKTQLSSVQLAELYANCMELCNRNKINQKNAWSVKLVDYLDDVLDTNINLLDEKGTNFQRHAATLDASVKIYSSRVDSVHSDTYKMLGGLSRGHIEEDEAEIVADGPPSSIDQNEDEPRKVTRGTFLETNESAISVKKIDMEFIVDPLFRKTSAAFDEGGARGLLVNHVNIYNGCEMILDSMDAAPNTESGFAPSTEVDLSPLQVLLLSFNPDFEKSEILPKYKTFKFVAETKELDDVAFEENNNDYDHEDVGHDDFGGGDLGWSDNPASTLIEQEKQLAADLEAGLFPTLTAYGSHNFDADHEVGIAESSSIIPYDIDSNLMDVEGSANHDMEERIVLNNVRGSTMEPMTPSKIGEIGRDFGTAFSMIEGRSNDYSYFNPKMLQNWNGLKHWKPTNTDKLTANTGSGTPVKDGDDLDSLLLSPSVSLRKRPLRERKQVFYIDFSAPSNPKEQELSSYFANAPPRSVTTLTRQALDNQENAVRAPMPTIQKNQLVLPEDEHYDPANFGKLFNKPNWTVRFGKRRKSVRATKVRTPSKGSLGDSDIGSGEPALDYSEFADSDQGTHWVNESALDSAPFEDDDSPISGGFDLATNMLSSPEKTERVQVKYATAHKTVDVKELKRSMWSEIAPNLSNDSTTEFQTIIDTMPQYIAPTALQDISVSYYFICLLHLCNEENLALEQSSDGELSTLPIEHSHSNQLDIRRAE